MAFPIVQSSRILSEDRWLHIALRRIPVAIKMPTFPSFATLVLCRVAFHRRCNLSVGYRPKRTRNYDPRATATLPNAVSVWHQ
jgi:hypothetical protein